MIENCDVLSATCRYLFVELKVKAGKGTMNCTNERNLGLLFSCPKMRFSYVLPYRTVRVICTTNLSPYYATVPTLPFITPLFIIYNLINQP